MSANILSPEERQQLTTIPTEIGDAELVPGVAVGARTETAVRIDPSYASVRPAFQAPVILDNDEGAVAFDAAQIDIVVVVLWVIEKSDPFQHPAVGKQWCDRRFGHLFRIELFCRFLTEWIQTHFFCFEIVGFQGTQKTTPCMLGQGVLSNLLGVAV